MSRGTKQLEYGDFQTPDSLAERACALMARLGVRPRTVLEPTCGTGSFVLAAGRAFSQAQRIIGLEINPQYFLQLSTRVATAGLPQRVDLRQADFYTFDWRSTIAECPKPVLVIGNLPWVTACRLGRLKSGNIPEKSNFMKLRGVDAKTGKSNFDIAEWMMIRLLEEMEGCGGTIAMLLKTAVVRRVLHYAWRSRLPITETQLFRFDAQKEFGANVDAGLLTCVVGRRTDEHACPVRALDSADRVVSRIAFRENELVSDADEYDRTSHLGTGLERNGGYRWRSGVKHDCGKVLELMHTSQGLVNGYGEGVEIEDDLIFPMMKGSSVATSKNDIGTRFMIVPQRNVRDDTQRLVQDAPRAWKYLEKYEGDFLARRSSIYRQRPKFAVFGVGDYTFEPWKVAVCGLYKKLSFAIVGPHRGRPVVFDDTVYQLACKNEAEARLIAELLQSPSANAFLSARIFWDSKRPITAQVLRRLDIFKLAAEIGRSTDAATTLRQDPLGACLFA